MFLLSLFSFFFLSFSFDGGEFYSLNRASLFYMIVECDLIEQRGWVYILKYLDRSEFAFGLFGFGTGG